MLLSSKITIIILEAIHIETRDGKSQVWHWFLIAVGALEYHRDFSNLVFDH